MSHPSSSSDSRSDAPTDTPTDGGERQGRSELTNLLDDIVAGDDLAAAKLLPLVYNQLRAIAHQRMRSENPGHTLQATALVHEAFLKLVGPRKIAWENQAHFYAAAAEAMRRILFDHARSKGRVKRGGKVERVVMSVVDLAATENTDEIMALDEAFCRLEKQEPEAAEVVRLRFYAGLTVDQVAKALEIGPRTVDRRWKFARAWLYRELNAT